MVLVVALGSALGGVVRAAIGDLAEAWAPLGFPYATVAINITGSLAIGLFGRLTAIDGARPMGPEARGFVMIGICGGYTTFSAFSLQTVTLAAEGHWPAAAANVLASILLCLAAVALGDRLAEGPRKPV
jgi:CrcB protein